MDCANDLKAAFVGPYAAALGNPIQAEILDIIMMLPLFAFNILGRNAS